MIEGNSDDDSLIRSLFVDLQNRCYHLFFKYLLIFFAAIISLSVCLFEIMMITFTEKKTAVSMKSNFFLFDRHKKNDKIKIHNSMLVRWWDSNKRLDDDIANFKHFSNCYTHTFVRTNL